MRPTMQERLDAGRAPCTDPACGCDCLLWTAHLNNKGYGVLSVHDYPHLVHRVAWETEVGPIPDGLTIDHVWARGCRHRHCANVAHLEPVTMRVNTLRGNSMAARNAVKTHCPHGHPYDDANTHFTPRGHRRCRACARVRDALRPRKTSRRVRTVLTFTSQILDAQHRGVVTP